MNRTVLITGASRGIGKACAIAFAQAGYDCILIAHKNQSGLNETLDDIKKYPVDGIGYLVDVSDDVAVGHFFEKIATRLPFIDVLINNAAITSYGLFTDLDKKSWDTILHTNLSSLYHFSSRLIPYMLQKKEGVILNLSSMWGQQGASCEVAYSATKGAIDAFSKALGKELAPSNIRVNAIACGVIETDMNAKLSEEEQQSLKEEIPMGRFGTPGEVADLAVFLASKQASYMTASIIPIQGGLYS
jgi:3-oxoacyl-[acyl-carrier protein] reductase